MPYVKTTTNALHFYDDEAALQKYAPTGSTPISDSDAATLQDQKKAAADLANAPLILKALAQTALSKSDTTLHRCFEAGLPLPADWAVYRKALRAIVGGADTSSTQLPAIPAYPIGT
jgi:hypothetical protein